MPKPSDRLSWRQTLTKLILHGHNDLHLVQAVKTQIFHKVGGCLQLWSTNQHRHQKCHFSSIIGISLCATRGLLLSQTLTSIKIQYSPVGMLTVRLKATKTNVPPELCWLKYSQHLHPCSSHLPDLNMKHGYSKQIFPLKYYNSLTSCYCLYVVRSKSKRKLNSV